MQRPKDLLDVAQQLLDLKTDRRKLDGRKASRDYVTSMQIILKDSLIYPKRELAILECKGTSLSHS